MCSPTRISYLQQLHNGDTRVWRHFAAAIKPLLRRWLSQYALKSEDVEDIVQEVLLFTANNIGQFEHNGRLGAFRKWLRSVTVNITRNHLRKIQREAWGVRELPLEELDDASSRASIALERDYQKALLNALLKQVETQFSAQTISIFYHHVLQESDAAETAQRHNCSKTAVYVAKSKVLRCLRETWGNGGFEP